MPQQAIIPFVPDQQSGDATLAGASPVAVNVVIDGKGAVTRRPGITTWERGNDADLSGNPVMGLFALSDQNVYMATGRDPSGQAEIWRATDTGWKNVTHGQSHDLTLGKRPIWAETEALVVLATNRAIHRIQRDDDDIAILSKNAPRASHVVAQSARLLANNPHDNKSLVYYSAPSLGETTYPGHEQWGVQVTPIGISGFFTAESRPDPVVALAENSNEVFVFGSTTMQVFAPDSNLVYAPTTTREFGCAAPYSVVKDDQSFAWLDDKRRFVSSDGRSVSILSEGIKDTLEEIKVVDDCFGYRVLHGTTDALVWTFPADGRTFAFQRGGGWSEWMCWNDVGNRYEQFAVNAHTLVPGTNDNVVGLLGGRVGVLRETANTDLGATIPASVTTGFQDRGTDNRKHCRSVRLALQRGAIQPDPPAETYEVAHLYFRDDDGPWQGPLEVSLGASGDRYPVVEFRGLGIYRRRQWRFEFHGEEELILAKATEEYDVLGN